MSLFSITGDRSNKDIPAGMTKAQAREHYMEMLVDMKPRRLAYPEVQGFEGKWIFRGDLCEAGLKAYGAEFLIQSCKEDVLVYCAPRVGQAMDSIATLALLYGKSCVFFCPASAEASDYQAALLSYPNVELRFVRIAAMPSLNGYAEKWAKKHGARFLPFGLAKTPLVTAGLVHLAAEIEEEIGHEPTEVWMAVSTGTAIRAFQIAWPSTAVHGIAVARNMHPGEIGEARLISSPLPFLKDAKEQPPFPSTANYDAKAWPLFRDLAADGAIFINVGCDAKIQQQLAKVDRRQINSQRDWSDKTDLERGL